MRRLMIVGMAAVVSFGPLFSAQAQNKAPTPEDLARQNVEMRQGLLKVMGWAFAPVGAMLRKPREPMDVAVVQKSATRIEQLSAMLSDAFQMDTHTYAIKTEARPNIWSSQADFNSKADAMVKSATALNNAAKSGDQGAMRKAAAEMGKTCGACHDSFRVK